MQGGFSLCNGLKHRQACRHRTVNALTVLGGDDFNLEGVALRLDHSQQIRNCCHDIVFFGSHHRCLIGDECEVFVFQHIGCCDDADLIGLNGLCQCALFFIALIMPSVESAEGRIVDIDQTNNIAAPL